MRHQNVDEGAKQMVSELEEILRHRLSYLRLEPFLVSDLFIRIRETLHRSIQYGVGVKPCLESEISLTIYFTLLSETDKVGPEVLASIRETVAQALAGRGLLESGADEATRESTREVEGD